VFDLPAGTVKGTRVTSSQDKKGGAPDVQTQTVDYDNFSSHVKLDDPSSGMGDFPVVTGSLPATGASITGQVAIPVHFDDQGMSTAGTLTVRYTLTQEAPTAPATRK